MPDFLREELEYLKSNNLYRSLRRVDSPPSAKAIVDGRECILLSSNNYLGLSEHPVVKEAATGAVSAWGAGTGGSRLISGNLGLIEDLEREIAAFKGTGAAVVFNTGYMANLGVITALTGRGDIIVSDELNHASIIDGCRLSRAETKVYRHKDMAHLEEILARPGGYRRRLIVTDSVFSMDGDIAPLPAITALADKYNAMVMVDEAHATGVLGPGGAGAASCFQLEEKLSVQMGTLSKALGCFGAFVTGRRELIDFLRNKARSFIFSTALPPAAAGAAIAAIRVVRNCPEIRDSLWANARRMHEGLNSLGFNVPPLESHIIPVMIGDEEKTMQMTAGLLENGVFAPGIRPPTVPGGTCRIRVTVMATHTGDDLDCALKAFERAGKKAGLI